MPKTHASTVSVDANDSIGRSGEEQREGEHQAERAGLAEPRDVDAAWRPAAASDDRDRRPPRPRGPARTTQNQSGRRRRSMIAPMPTKNSSRSTVGSNILPSVRHLVEVAGDVAVDPVGRAEAPRAARPRASRLSCAEQQPEEHRQAQQADQRDHVGHREDPVARGSPTGRSGGDHGTVGAGARFIRRSVRSLTRWRSDVGRPTPSAPLARRTHAHALHPHHRRRAARAASSSATTAASRSCRSRRSAPATRSSCPIDEVDHWIDLDPDLERPPDAASRRRSAGRSRQAFAPDRGRPDDRRARGAARPPPRRARSTAMHDLDFANADPTADPAALDDAADRHPPGARR